jgi:hypothetical protein
LPQVVELPDGRRSIEIEDGLRFTWGWKGKTCILRIEGDDLQGFHVNEESHAIAITRPKAADVS